MNTIKQHSKKLILFILILILTTGCTDAKVPKTVPLGDLTTFEYATTEKAHELLAREDEYINGFTAFDLVSKVPTEEKTIEEYIRVAKESADEWSPTEIERINEHIDILREEVLALNLNIELPETIYLIKSFCREEGGAAGYTRQNFIVLNKNLIDLDLVTHEFFHIVSRYNPKKAEKIYETIGFTPVDKLNLPSVLKENIITNPDATDLNYAIEVTHNNTSKKGNLLIYSPKDYTGGSFLSYITIGLYFSDNSSSFELSDMISIKEVSGFYEQIGKNTGYIIHPEEISAEHFRILMTDPQGSYPDDELIDKLKTILQE